jgi:hypothetical protein
VCAEVARGSVLEARGRAVCACMRAAPRAAACAARLITIATDNARQVGITFPQDRPSCKIPFALPYCTGFPKS